jgi:hypothetical protein
MKVTDEILNEWSFRCHDGIVDLNDPKKLRILKEILDENGITLNKPQEETIKEEEITNGEPMVSVTKNELDSITKVFRNPKFQDDYKKYLTVFHYFSPNALGEISEIIITNLINKYGGDIQADHTGGSQGLDDIKLKDGTKISLKTTKSTLPIGLGSNIEAEGDNDKIVNYFKEKYNKPEKENFEVEPIKNILGPIKDEINKKVKAIVDKLSGTGEEKELFVWIEKISIDNILSSLKIHVFDFDNNEVKKKLENGILYITKEGAWGIRDNMGKGNLVQADKGKGKTLNVTPNFINSMYKQTTSPEPIIIIKPEEIQNIENQKDVKYKVTENFFTALDMIYDDIFKK